MHLAAESLTIDFPLSQLGHSQATAPGTQPLGGHIHGAGRRTYVRALDDITFRLEDGDRLAIVGHNGSGKSTLLRVLAGIYHPTHGRVRASGPVSGIFNMSLGFRQEASGYRNLVLKGLMAGRSRREIEAALPEIAEFTGLGPYLDMPLHAYSQGMAMRLAFAATTAFSNDILVMDEWIGAGDAGFQEKVVSRMNGFLETAHICVLASHNNGLLRRLTDRCLWLEEGRVRMLGDTAEVLALYEEETDEIRKATQEAAVEAAPRLPIPEGHPVLRITPPSKPGSWAVELAWDLEPFNIGKVRLMVYNPRKEEEQLVCSAPASGSRKTGEWVRPGLEFRLYDELDDLLLGTATVTAEDVATASQRPAPVR